MAMEKIELPFIPNEPDYISRLPDDILCSILSDLPIKEVVRTSILAKRFRLVWTWVPCLNLDPHLMIPKAMREQELSTWHRNLATHHLLWLIGNHQGPLRRVQIVHSYVDGLQRLPRRWLHLISADRLIHELSLVAKPFNYELKGDMGLPVGIFHDLRSLHTLELTNYFIRRVEAFLGCTNLKSMTLNHVNVSSRCLSWVISQCPNLEHLRMESVGRLYDLKVHSEKLEVLEISENELSSVDIWCENLRVLALDDFYCSKRAVVKFKISIIVPKVEYVRIHSYMEGAEGFIYDKYGQLMWFQVYDNAAILLSRINHPKPYLQDNESCIMNPLENIKELRLYINVNSTSGAVSIGDAFMQCINLQILSITIESNNMVLDRDLPYPNGTFWENYIRGCIGVEEQLRNVSIRNFTGRDLEVGMVSFLASRAKKLERMVIVHQRGKRLSRAQRYFMRNLRAMPKANENASIEFQF